jgi:sensor histidine kinase YesM
MIVKQINRVLLIIYLLQVSLSPTNLMCQDYYSEAVNYTNKDGLISNTAYCVLQDRMGYIWVGTQQGISRFNGYDFINYGVHDGLTDPEISHIIQDTNDVIWFCSIWGSVYFLDRNIIQKYRYQNKLDSILKLGAHITGIDIIATPLNKDVELYIGLQGIGLVHVDKSGKTERISIEQHCPSVIYYKNDKIKFTVAQSCSNKLFLCNSCPQKVNFYIYTNNAYKFLASKKLIAHQARFLHTFGSKVIFGFSKLAIIIDQTTKAINVINDIKSLSGFQEISDGNFMFSSSFKSGISYGNIIDLKFNVTRKDNSVKGNVTSIIRDNQSNFWLSTLDNGIYKLQYSNELRILEKADDFNRKHSYKKISYDSFRNYLWFNNERAELIKYSIRTGSKTVMLDNIDHFNEIYSYNGNTYVATNNSIIYLRNNRKYNLNHTYFKEYYVKGFASFHNKDTLLAYNNSGVFYLVNNVLYPCVEQMTHATLKSMVIDILESNDRKIYCVYLDSIRSFNPYFKRIRRGFEQKFISKPNTIKTNNSGELLFGTRDNGVISVMGKKITSLTKATGLMSDEILSIEIDNTDNFWVLSKNGFDKISFQNGIHRIENYPLSKYNNLKSPIDFVVFENYIWFVTIDGIFQLSTEKVVDINRKPLFESILDFNNNPILDPSKINYSDNSLIIRWCTLDFSLNANINYRYKLKNTDPWIETNSRTLALNKLEPSEYFLQIQSKGMKGKWSDALIIPFFVKPPWWRSTQFFVITFIMCSLFIGFVMLNRESKLKLKFKQLKYINELRNKAVISQVNPHFIFNCLNSIKLLIKQSKNSEAERYLNNFAKMIRYSIRAVQSREWSINEEVSIIKNYIELENLRVKDKIVLKVIMPALENISEIFVPSMILQPLIENSVKHGFTTAIENLNITVTIKVEINFLIIEIVDNGIGILNESKNRPDFIEEGEHIGLELTKKRLSYYNGTEDYNMELISPNDPVSGTGTKIVLYIRLNYKDEENIYH